MKTPIPIETIDIKPLNLAIKTSFSNPKEAIALALLIWEAVDCAGKPIRIHEEDEFSKETAKLSRELLSQVIALLSSHEVPFDDTALAETMNKSWLLEAQYESLAMGLQYVWKIAEVSFCDGEKSSASERTGQLRYAKTLSYAKNAYIVHAATNWSPRRYISTLCNWIGLPNTNADDIIEDQLLRLITMFSEDVILKIRTESPYYYCPLGIYQVLNSGEPAVQFCAKNDGVYEEKVGPTRVLARMVKDGLHYYLAMKESDTGALTASSSDSKPNLIEYEKIIRTSRKIERMRKDLSISDNHESQVSGRTIQQDSDERQSACSKAENIIYYGIPGCGKSHHVQKVYCGHNCYIERVVFHPDYSYADFVGQILPKCEDQKIEYKFEPGPFTRILKRAHDDPEHNYYLIIEELNRGNAPAIFGDIFQLLDRVKETDSLEVSDNNVGQSYYSICNKDIALAIGCTDSIEVRIPHNLSIIATMNTADQNVFTLDTAFKRRWRMKNIRSKMKSCDYRENELFESGISWQVFVTTINKFIITDGIDDIRNEDKRIGAFFLQKEDLEDVNLFASKMLMYLWTDAFKTRRSVIFKEEFRTLDDLLEEFAENKFAIFNDMVHKEFDLQKRELATSSCETA